MIPEFHIHPAYVALIVRLAFCAFMAILFLQSGLDKVFDRKGNLEWLNGHFAKSPLGGIAPLLLTVLTFTEVLAGLGSVFGGIMVLLGSTGWAFLAMVLCTCNFLMLFFGQRMAKDYAGAAGIVPYFVTALFGMVMLGMPL